MAKFTLLEINLDGAQLTAKAPFSDGSEHPDAVPGGVDDPDEALEDGKSSTKRPWLAALVGLLFLAVLAVVAKKKLGGAADAGVDLDEPDIDR